MSCFGGYCFRSTILNISVFGVFLQISAHNQERLQMKVLPKPAAENRPKIALIAIDSFAFERLT